MRTVVLCSMAILLVLAPFVLSGCGEERSAVVSPNGSFEAADSSATPAPQGVNQYQPFPSGWKFPFFGTAKITVGYNGAVCGGGYDQYHTGNERYAIDWSQAPGNGDIGRPLPAPASGWATAYWSNTGYGNQVVVYAGNGYSYRIAHMDQIYLNYCGWVERGQVLGTLGCSGNCDGAHIHFVVYRNGVSVPQNGMSGQWDLQLCGTYPSGQ